MKSPSYVVLSLTFCLNGCSRNIVLQSARKLAKQTTENNSLEKEE